MFARKAQVLTGQPLERSAQSLADTLGPFLPEQHRLEPEFLPPSPRPIPPAIRRSPHQRLRAAAVASLSVLGVLGIVFAESGPVRDLAYYILVLQHLKYIGWGFLTLAAIILTTPLLRPGRLEYLRSAYPVPARIVCVDRSLKDNRVHQFLYLHVTVQFRHPERGSVEFATLRSDHLTITDDPTRYAVAAAPGDYVTVVGFPGRFDKSLKLYGFLRLNPANNFVLRDGKPVTSYWFTLAATLFTLGILVLVVGGIWGHYFERCAIVSGLDWPWIAGTAGGAAFGIVAVVSLMWAQTRGGVQARCSRRNWIGAILAGFMFGAVAGFSGTLFINAALDSSASRVEDIEVENFWQETSRTFYVRNYKIEFRLFPSGTMVRFPAHVDEMDRFMQTRLGVAEVGEGAFNMGWIRAIYPLVLVPLDPTDPPDMAVASMEVETGSGTAEQIDMKAMIERAEGNFEVPTESLMRRLRRKALERDGR